MILKFKTVNRFIYNKVKFLVARLTKILFLFILIMIVWVQSILVDFVYEKGGIKTPSFIKQNIFEIYNIKKQII